MILYAINGHINYIIMKNEQKNVIKPNEAVELKSLSLASKQEEKGEYRTMIFSPNAEHPTTHYTYFIQNDQKNRNSKQENSNQVNLKNQQVRQTEKIESKNKKPKLPTMKAKCNSCQKVQIISAKKEQFKCESCGEKSSCNPIYGVISCSGCAKKVLFMKGVATMIRCTNCSTINIISKGERTQIPEQQN